MQTKQANLSSVLNSTIAAQVGKLWLSGGRGNLFAGWGEKFFTQKLSIKMLCAVFFYVVDNIMGTLNNSNMTCLEVLVS